MGTYVAHVGEGLVGGLVGSAFMSQMMALQPKLPAAIQGPQMKGHPGEFVVQKGESLIGRIPDQHRDKTVSAMHWAYGAGWGAGLGLVAPFIGVRSLGRACAVGAVMGAACWAAGYAAWMPAAGLVDPLPQQGASHIASSFGLHVAFGVVSGLAMHLLDRVLVPENGLFDLVFPKKWSLWGLVGELLR